MDMVLLQNNVPPETLGILVVAIIVVLVLFALFVNHKTKGGKWDKEISQRATTVDDYIAIHGEPEAILVLDSIKANDLNSVVLVYEEVIIVEGKSIMRDCIADASFYNAQVPYMDKEYHLVLTLSDKDIITIEVPMGNDLENAEYVVEQLKNRLSL